jgi:hypothetical protein
MTQTFQSLEDEMVRSCALRLVSLPLWNALSPGRLQLELHGQPTLAKKWKALTRKEAKAAKAVAAAGGGGGGGGFVPAAERPEAKFLPGVMEELLETLGRVGELLEIQAGGKAAGGAADGGGAVGGVGIGDEEEEEEEDAEAGLQALLGDEERHGGDVEGAAEGEGGDGAAAPAEGGEVVVAAAGGNDTDVDAASAGLNGLEAAADAEDAAAAAAGEEQQEPTVAPEEGTGRGALRRAVVHCERGAELLIDLLSQLPTRRFVHAVLEDKALLVKARRSALYREERWGERFRQLLDLLAFYVDFPIDDHTGEALTEDEVTSHHYEKVGLGWRARLGSRLLMCQLMNPSLSHYLLRL